jgi:hypothetical protein
MTPSTTMSTIHLTNGDVAAESLRSALQQAGRDEAVLPLRDDLAVGPLRGSDEAPVIRAEFWRRVTGDSTRDFIPEFEAQEAALEELVHGSANVVVWHGQSSADQLTLRRVCFYLREAPQRLNEVRLSFDDLTSDGSAAQRRADRATSVGMFAPEVLQSRLPSAAPISVWRISRLALEWQQAREADADMRRWRDDAFSSGRFAELDARVFEHAVDGWQPAGRVAASVMLADNGLLISDWLVLWRLRELANAGQLQLRGNPGDWRSLELNVLRPTFSPA